jgi:hypothetical protein
VLNERSSGSSFALRAASCIMPLTAKCASINLYNSCLTRSRVLLLSTTFASKADSTRSDLTITALAGLLLSNVSCAARSAAPASSSRGSNQQLAAPRVKRGMTSCSLQNARTLKPLDCHRTNLTLASTLARQNRAPAFLSRRMPRLFHHHDQT